MESFTKNGYLKSASITFLLIKTIIRKELISEKLLQIHSQKFTKKSGQMIDNLPLIF